MFGVAYVGSCPGVRNVYPPPGSEPSSNPARGGYGSAPMVNWLVEEKQITPHIPVIDKSKREEPSS